VLSDSETRVDRVHCSAVSLAALTRVAPARAPGYGIIPVSPKGRTAMEAERLNQIAATLTGLRARAADLRRYL
jgi:hypothetical protein